MNKKCQIFTPNNYVEELLDSVGYNENLYGKKFLENSCGDGNILVVAVQRYINDCVARGISRTKIKNGLARDIYGIEIDIGHYKKCLENLNEVAKKNNIESVKWNIHNQDFLRWNEQISFQFIVGNPPYITYSDLAADEQKYVKSNFETCTEGKFDYCYAFIEKSIKSLDCDGRMAYLIPSSIFKTVFGKNLRNFIKTYIVEIKDYPQEKLFNDVLVKSSIIVLDKNRENEEIRYTDMSMQTSLNININNLSNKWLFTNKIIQGRRRFGDYFKVSHVIATLLNEAYVLKEGDYIETEQGFLCKGHNIEKLVVKETATPKTLRYQKQEKLIFPYCYVNGALSRFEVEEFEKTFPNATAYLNEFREKLDKRKSDKRKDDKSNKWFEYGRSQALSGLNCEKLLLSTVVTKNVTVYKLSRECIPYGGMYIVPKGNQYTLDCAMEILSSKRFKQYVLDVGIHISGCSLRITSRDIENYLF